jgi:hypothetical protein
MEGKCMDFFSSPDDQGRKDELKQDIAGQLLQITNLHHIDDVFLWLVHTIVHRFGAQVAQVWAMQSTDKGQLFPQLRSVMRQDRSLSQNIVANPHVASLAGHMLSTQRDIPLHPVDASFTQYVALLLKRHGLYYCAGTCIKRDTLLPPPRTSTSGQKIATPLVTGLLLFFQHLPGSHTLASIEDTLKQALTLADTCGLLCSNTDSATIAYPQIEPAPSLPARPALSDLLARRIDDPLNNPISSAATLPEEQMRRVYAAINDKRNMAELAMLTNLELKDILLIVRKLAAIQRIQIYDPTGRRLDDLSIFDG